MTTFFCSICGQGHEGIVPIPSEVPPEQIAALRAAWLAADQKLEGSPQNEHFEKAAQKAWLAYGATMQSGVERLPDTITTKKRGSDSSVYFTCCGQHVSVATATEGFRYSTDMVRQPERVPGGIYLVLDSRTNEAGEKWLDLRDRTGTVRPIIVETHWGLTPFGRQLRTEKIAQDLEPRALEPWVVPPRCGVCCALVHPDHLPGHLLYNCLPGLHHPQYGKASP